MQPRLPNWARTSGAVAVLARPDEPEWSDEAQTRGAATAGRILRLKLGYNPNSSSIGTIVFGMPAALLLVTTAFTVAAGMLCAAALRRPEQRRPASAPPPEAGATPAETTTHGGLVGDERPAERGDDAPPPGEAPR